MHDLPHHRKIIACLRREFAFILDIETTIRGFLEAFRPGDNHAADSMFALNMRIIVNLDPFRRLGQAKRDRQLAKQPLL